MTYKAHFSGLSVDSFQKSIEAIKEKQTKTYVADQRRKKLHTIYRSFFKGLFFTRAAPSTVDRWKQDRMSI